MKPNREQIKPRSLYEVQLEIHRITITRLGRMAMTFSEGKHLNVLRELTRALKENEKLKAENEQLRECLLEVRDRIDGAECRDDLDGIKGFIDEVLQGEVSRHLGEIKRLEDEIRRLVKRNDELISNERALISEVYSAQEQISSLEKSLRIAWEGLKKVQS